MGSTALFGPGLKKVLLLAGTDAELTHPMTDRLLRRSGQMRENFIFGRSSEPGIIQAIQTRGVKVVGLLGERALRETLGESGIERWRGRTVAHPHLPGVWVVPMLQPSELMSRRPVDGDDEVMRHPPRFHGIWMRDMHWINRVVAHGFSRASVDYLEDPTPFRFEQFADEYERELANDPRGCWLSWDIETYYKQGEESEEELDSAQLDGEILRISFSFRPGYAVSVPWSPSYWPTIRRLLRSRGIHIVWNGTTFDIPVVTAAGFEVLGEIYEGMDAYHLYQSDLPKGLEWVTAEATDLLPWKHLAQARPAYYSCIDADAALRNMKWLQQRLLENGQWFLFVNHVVRLMPILDAAGHRGNLMDREKREEIRTVLIAMKNELIAEAQNYVPRQLKPRSEYKRLPDVLKGTPDPDGSSWPSFEPRAATVATGTDGSDWDIRFEPEDVKTCSHCGQLASNKTEHYKGGKKNPCKAASGEIVKKPAFVPRFLLVEDFNPNSSDQMKVYLAHFGHPVGKDKKDATKETVDANHLKFLAKKFGAKFPIYALTLQLHKAIKTIGTYTPEPDADGFLHTQYVNSPSTWRFGSRKVKFGTQIQNWGKREENKYAKEARKQIIARPGHKLVQIDSSAVEAVMQGYYMNDPEYMRTASKSIHAWLACKKLGLEFSPANVELVKEKHTSLYNEMKVTNYLTNFGGGAWLLSQTFPDLFPSKDAAQAAQDSLYALLPTLRAYHHATRWEAHTKTFLTTPWGYRHWYYDVFKPGPGGQTLDSKDSKRAVALRPQNSNAAFQKDNLLLTGLSEIGKPPVTDIVWAMENWDSLRIALDEGRTWAQFMPTNVSIHDSLCLDTPDALVDEAAGALLAIFTRPIPQMRGLRIGAEVEVGENWGAMTRHSKLVVDDYTYAETEAGLQNAA